VELLLLVGPDDLQLHAADAFFSARRLVFLDLPDGVGLLAAPACLGLRVGNGHHLSDGSRLLLLVVDVIPGG
jgi:hypothetical protein